MKGMKIFNKKAGLRLAAVLMAGMILSGEAAVYAEEETGTETTVVQQNKGEGIEMTTDYPGITTKAGETVSFALNFKSLSGESCDAALSVSDLPDGWTGYFKGSSSEITRIHIDGDASDESAVTADFNLILPDEAEEGTYTAELTADAGDYGTSTLELEIVVNEAQNGQSSFSSEYPEQRGSSGTSFSFNTTLINNRGTAQTYSLSADAPTGWSVSFTPSSESADVASVPVDAGGSESITVGVTPPETITEGEYTIPISAVSSSDTLSTDLKVTITGSYTVSLSTPSENLSVDAYSNDQTSITLTVTNTGNVDLKDLELTSSAPTDWEVSFSESAIDTLEAGGTKEVTAYLTPSSDAINGDYVTTITVSNSLATSSAQFRVSVKTRTTWGIAAVVIILILLAVLRFIFKKYGRR